MRTGYALGISLKLSLLILSGSYANDLLLGVSGDARRLPASSR